MRESGDPDSTWALPYWAYLNEDQTVMPELLRDQVVFVYPLPQSGFNAGASINELGVDGLQPATWSDQALVGLDSLGYLSMGGRIESIPHNQFHVLG